MRVRVAVVQFLLLATVAGPLFAQVPSLSNIESPYPPIQGSVQMGGVVYGSGAVAYGPVNAPLVLSGKDFGSDSEGTVKFTPIYRNGSSVTFGTPVVATVTMWSSSILFVTVPSGAASGQVTITTQGRTSNALPFVVTHGVYTAMCPAFPPNNVLEVTTSSLPNGAAGQAYSATLSAGGGAPPYTWSLTGNPLPNGLTLASTGVISGTPTTGANPVNVTVKVTDSHSLIADAVLSLTIDSSSMLTGPIYSYSVPAGGYDHVGNVLGYTDEVMGTWTLQYDHLNRLMSATQGVDTFAPYHGQYLCFDYDSFGNRTQSDLQTTACNPNPAPSLAPSSYDPSTAAYNAANKITWLQNQALNGLSYDGSGNATYDGINYYSYDTEGRICATQTMPYSGGVVAYGYLYDAEGRRVAKGTVNPAQSGQSPSCDPSSNGFTLTESYVLGQGGERLTTSSWAGGASTWENTNVYAEGKLIATYDSTLTPSGRPITALHFQLNDPLGTRRIQANTAGQPELDCQSLPYGDQLNCFPDPGAPGDDPSEDATGSLTGIHFTGKERDQESGNDYFGARYYGSNMGRFMSPDPSRLSIIPINPQTWNRYAYGSNNPLRFKDDNGKWPTEIHNQIIDNAFPNLSASQRQILKNVSASQDSILGGGQANGSAFEHAMRSPGQTVEQAQTQYNNFVSSSETEAQNAQMQFWMADPDNKLDNLSDASLEAFGEALHAVLDSTSPAHSGFQEWNWMNPFAVRQHINAEKTISPQQMQNAVNAARNAYNATYGYLIGDMGTASVTTFQGNGTPCDGKSGNPCPK
jgi:RHS repeat-associated protein